MATINTVKTPDRSLKATFGYGSPTRVPVNVTLAADLADNGDVVNLFTVPKGYVVTDFKLQLSGTLGASATVTARVGTRALGAASTAGAANNMVQTIADLPDLATADRDFNLLVGGADFGTAATLKGFVEIAPARG